MRTRKEQIADLSCAIFNQHDNIDECLALARKYILEAERRAEQRMRAEIGLDSERLDWFCRNVRGPESRRMVGVIADTGNLGLWRQAIDAAREVG